MIEPQESETISYHWYLSWLYC